jgi:hypothetical protein
MQLADGNASGGVDFGRLVVADMQACCFAQAIDLRACAGFGGHVGLEIIAAGFCQKQ